MKPKASLDRSKSIDSNTSTASSSGTLSCRHRYNLRSKGPPRYVQFSDMECPICLEDYTAPVIVNCGHSFCSACIDECIKTASHSVCPICKETLVRSLFIESGAYTKQITIAKTEQRSSGIIKVPKTEKPSKANQSKRRTVL